MFQPGPDWSGPPMAVLLNKCDLLSEEQIEELKQWYLTNCRAEKVRACWLSRITVVVKAVGVLCEWLQQCQHSCVPPS